MRLTQETIRRIIKEELENVLSEEELLNEDLPDCPDNRMKVSDLFAAAVISAATKEERKQLYDLASTGGDNSVLKKISDSLQAFGMKKARVEKLGTIAKFAGVFTATAVALGVALPALPVIGAATLGVGGAAGATAGAAMIGSITDVVGGMLMGKEEKKLFNNDSAKQLMKLFCIDMKLLALLDNGLQTQFIKESDIKDEIKQFFMQADPSTELPDLNKTLIDWINGKNLDRTLVAPKTP